MERINTEASKYVVFDVETNGLKSKEDDLLSISFYKPDDGKQYSRFLPLELSKTVKTTKYNGIKTEDLVGLQPLTQSEFDFLCEEFELDRRIILTYSGNKFDELFLREYLQRKHIYGFERLTFYNFKRQLISSRFSEGNVSKDNMCTMFGIQNVQNVHSGSNDCILEWELFKKLDGYYYLITQGSPNDNVFRMNPGYIVPVSYLSSHPNLGKILKRPYITCKSTEIKTFEIDPSGIKHFETNFNGMVIEHLIDTMLEVKEINSQDFLRNNKSKLDFVGTLPTAYELVPMEFNKDGTVTAIKTKDKGLESEINQTVQMLKKRLIPLVDYIKEDIFQEKPIKSQELVINKQYNILSLCDLSTDDTVMEIKTSAVDASEYKEQFFYEAKGRKCFHLKMDWQWDWKTYKVSKMVFIIAEIETAIGEPPSKGWTDMRRLDKRLKIMNSLKEILKPLSLDLIEYSGSTVPIKVKCMICGSEFDVSYSKAKQGLLRCETCHPTAHQPQKLHHDTFLNEEERKMARAKKYSDRIAALSNGKLDIYDYVGAKENVRVECKICGHAWKTRADHLISRCVCPKCKRNGL